MRAGAVVMEVFWTQHLVCDAVSRSGDDPHWWSTFAFQEPWLPLHGRDDLLSASELRYCVFVNGVEGADEGFDCEIACVADYSVAEAFDVVEADADDYLSFSRCVLFFHLFFIKDFFFEGYLFARYLFEEFFFHGSFCWSIWGGSVHPTSITKVSSIQINEDRHR